MSRDWLVGDIFTNAALAVPDRLAAVVDGESLTFEELNVAGVGCALALHEIGVQHGHLVMTWTDTALDLVPVFVGLAHLGAVFAPINGQLGLDEAMSMGSVAAPRLLLVDDTRLKDGVELARRLGVEIINVSGVVERRHEKDPEHQTVQCLRELLTTSDDSYSVPWRIGEDDPHVVFFTSGSTGSPKGVVLSHRMSVLRSHPGALISRRGPTVCPYPMFHMSAWTQAMQAWHGRDMVIFTGGDAGAICGAVERYRATNLNCIPAVWRRILDHLAGLDKGDLRRPDLSSLQFADSGTSATPRELLRQIATELPFVRRRVFYGSTEGFAATILEDEHMERKPGSVGVVAPLAEVRLASDGEIQVRGPLVFNHYLEDECATSNAFEEGWYRTGDLGEQDDEGFVRVVGRRGDVIRTGGENVVPSEVEAILAEHPSVSAVAVVGLPDDHWGQTVCAAVVVQEGMAPPALEDLAKLCHGRLARFKYPRRLAVLEDLPKTAATGQVQRGSVAELIREAVEGVAAPFRVNGKSI